MVKRKRSLTLPLVVVKREFLEEHHSAPINQNGSSLVTLLTQKHRTRASDLIFSYLDITDIIALTRVSKALSTVYTDSIPCYWDINSRLIHFVGDPKDFRRVLGKNESLIVGSIAFQFFSRVHWEDSTLDIFVESGPRSTAMYAYLRNEGYHRHRDKFICGPKYRYKMASYVKQGDKMLTINVITADLMSMWTFFEGPAFSTVNSCFITWDGAYCLFPKFTFVTRKLKFAHGLDTTYDQVLPILHRYAERGCCLDDRSFEQGPDMVQECRDTIKHLEGTRRIGDKKTWIIPLDCAGVPQADVNRTVVEKNTFHVRVERGAIGSDLFVKLQTLKFECCMLRNRYTFGAVKDPYVDFHEYLRFVLCRRAAVQIEKHLDTGTFTLSRL